MAPASGAKAAKRADGQAFATSAADAATRPSITPAKLTPAPVSTPRSQPSASPAIPQPIATTNSGGVFSPAPYDSSMKVQDGRVRGPVPSKLKGVVKAKDGAFNVMLMAGPATGDMHTRDAEAKRASENTAMAAKKAVEQGPPSARRAKFVPVASQEPNVPIPVVPPPRRLPLSDYETKAEQARLLTLLRTIPPVDVVNQICKALAYFGGTPDAPPPADGNFPFSEKANGPGKFFVGWISEIFPYVPNLAIGPPGGLTAVQVGPEQPASVRAQVYAEALRAQIRESNEAERKELESLMKRPRGRPKGSGSSKSRQDKGQTMGPGLPHNAHAETPQRGVGDDSSVGIKENETISSAGPSVVGLSTPVAAPAASINALSSVKRRGRPKGSKNRPKEATAVPNSSAAYPGTGSQPSQSVQRTHAAPPSREPHSTQPSFDGQERAPQPVQSQEATQPAANVSSFTPVNQTNQTPVAPASAAPVSATPDTATPSKKRVGRPKGSKTKTKPDAAKPDAVKPATANVNHSQPAATVISTPPPQPTTLQQGSVTHSQPSQDQLNEQPIIQGKETFSVDAQTRTQGNPDSSSQPMIASSATWGAPPPPVKASQGSRGKHNHSQGQLNHKQAQSSSQISSVTAPPSAPKPLAANPNQSVAPASQPERQKRKYTKRKSKDISSTDSATPSHSQPTSQQTLQATTDIGSSSQGTSLTHQDPAVQQPTDHKTDDSPAPPPAKKARRTKKAKPDVQSVVAQNKPSSGTDVPATAPSPPAGTNMVTGADGSVGNQVQPSSHSVAHDDLSLDDIHASPHGHFGLESPTMENYEAQLQAQLDQESEPQLQLLQDAIRDDRDDSSNLDSTSHPIEQQPQQPQQQSPEQTPWLYQRRAQQPQQQPLRQQVTQQVSQSLQKQPTKAASQKRTSLPQQRGKASQSQSASPVASQATASAAPASQSLYRATGYQLNSKQTYSPQQTVQQQSSSWQQTPQPPTQNTQSQQYPAADQQQQGQQPQQYTSNQQTYSGAQSQWTATQQQQASGQQRYQPQAAATAATTSYNSNANQPVSFSSGFSSSGAYRSSPAGIVSPFSTNQRLQSGNSSMSTPTSYRTSSSQSLGQQQARTSSMDSLNPAMNPYQQQQHQRSSSSNMSAANPQQGMGMGLGAASMPSFTTNSQTAEWNLFGSSNAGQQQQSTNDMNLGTASSYGVNNRTSSFPAAGMPTSTSVYGQASLSGYDASGVLGRQGGYYGSR